MKYLNRMGAHAFDAMLERFFEQLRKGELRLDDLLVEVEIACYPFAEVINISTPGAHAPNEHIAFAMGKDHMPNFGCHLKGEQLLRHNGVTYTLGERIIINLFRSYRPDHWQCGAFNNDELVYIAYFRCLDNEGNVSKLSRVHLHDDTIPADIKALFDEHL